MDVFRLAGMAMATAVLALTLKGIKPELGMQTALAGGVVILGYAAVELLGVVKSFDALMKDAGVDKGIAALVLRIVGIAFIVQIASDICRDAGESALASKVEICGRLMMISAALPMLTALITTVAGMLRDYL